MALAGYSGTPLAKKLGIRAAQRVCVVGAPPGFERSLAPLPEEVELRQDLRGRALCDVLLLFVREREQLERRFDALRRRMQPAAGLWISWPKKSSGLETDLSDAVVRAFGLASGLVDNKVCAIDETWSALRFVIRLADR